MDETKEYLEIMAGRKRLEIEYKTGDFVSGYTAFGLHARIIESLHCGQYIDGWGFLIDREFEDGDIIKMKRHFFEWKEMIEIQKRMTEENELSSAKEKERDLEGVIWSQKEQLQLYGGLSYIHSIRIQDKDFIFEEKKTSGMGRVITPLHEISTDQPDDCLPKCVDEKWFWFYICEGKEKKVPMTKEEEKAYLIVYRYGKLAE